MHVELSRHGHCSAEPEESVKQVQASWNEFVEGELFLEGDGDQIEQCKHRENRAKHVVVNHRWVSCKRCCNHVADKGHHQECEEELWQG